MDAVKISVPEYQSTTRLEGTDFKRHRRPLFAIFCFIPKDIIKWYIIVLIKKRKGLSEYKGIKYYEKKPIIWW